MELVVRRHNFTWGSHHAERMTKLLLVLLGSLLVGVLEAKTVLYVALKGDECIDTYDVYEDGSIALMGRYKTGGGVGPLAIDSRNKNLYASIRTTNEFASYHIDKRGKLSLNNVIKDENDANYISVHPLGRHLLASYYKAGQVGMIDIDSDGSLVQDSGQYIKTGRCAHMAKAVGRNNDIIVPATCSNRIFKFQINWLGSLSRNGDFIAGSRGSYRAVQPRHFVAHPSMRWIFVSNEADNSVSRYRYNEFTGALSDDGKTSTLPITWQFLSLFFKNKVAQIHMTSNGRYLYVSNRGHDSIAAFEINPVTGWLSSLGYFRTQAEPRAFALTPDDKFLYAAGLGTGQMDVFKVQLTGHLNRLQTFEVGQEPMWLEFMDLGGGGGGSGSGSGDGDDGGGNKSKKKKKKKKKKDD